MTTVAPGSFTLLLFSYPLHPPGKPVQLRTEHFPRIRVPVVFLHGTADPFGSIPELEEADRVGSRSSQAMVRCR